MSNNGLPAPPAPRLESLDNLDLSAIFGNVDEFHSVDDFFTSYVAELTNRSKRAGGELSTDPMSKQLRTGDPGATFNLPPGLSGSQGSLSLGDMNRQAPQISPFLGPNGMSVSPELLQQAGLLALQQQQFKQGGGGRAQQASGAAAGLPHAKQQALNPPIAAAGSGGAVGGPRYSNNDVVNSPRTSAEYGSVQRFSGGPRNKSARQQEANKIAQQRYRERKKQKFSELEKQVELMQQELAKLETVAARNEILEGMNGELQKALVEREHEVERLKIELDSAADASLGGASEDSEGVAAAGTNAKLAGNNHQHGPAGSSGPLDQVQNNHFSGRSVSCDVLPRDLSGIDFESGFAAQIESLRVFLEKHKLEDFNIAAEDVPDNVIGELAQLVGTSCQLCQAAIRAEGARVLELIAGDPSQLSSATHPAQDRFHAALDAMKMTPQQQEQLLLLRGSHLEKMREIYAERQALNLQAMALMLPHHSRNPVEDNTLEGKMENISNFGYLPVAKSNAELVSVLDSIKDNLRREQRSAMDINCATISKVLTPLQGAHYMTAVYPQHCDALALSNVLAHRLGRDSSGNQPGAGQGDGGSRANLVPTCGGGNKGSKGGCC